MQRGLRNCPPNRPNPTVLTGTALASVPASAALPEPGEPDASAKAREFSLSLPSKDVTSLKEADKAASEVLHARSKGCSTSVVMGRLN